MAVGVWVLDPGNFPSLVLDGVALPIQDWYAIWEFSGHATPARRAGGGQEDLCTYLSVPGLGGSSDIH